MMTEGGPVMWLLLGCGLLGLFLFLMKTFQFHREEINVRELIKGLQNVLKRDGFIEALIEIALTLVLFGIGALIVSLFGIKESANVEKSYDRYTDENDKRNYKIQNRSACFLIFSFVLVLDCDSEVALLCLYLKLRHLAVVKSHYRDSYDEYECEQ